MRVFFPGPDDRPEPDWTLERWRELPNRQLTPRSWDAEAGVLEVEFVLHGDGGVAGRYAGSGELGSVVAFGGPRGSQVLDGTPDAWFLAGDETAAAAIARFLADAGPDAVGVVVLEVADADHEIPLEPPAGVTVRYVHRAESSLALALEEYGAADRPGQPGDAVFGFVAGESAVVKPGRELLHTRWGLDPEQTVIKGYWKRGEISS